MNGAIDVLIIVVKTGRAFLSFYCRDLHGLLFFVWLRWVVSDKNSCPSIFIKMFWSHYWPAFRRWAAMRYMLQSTLSLMWPLLLTHWQCNLTKLMTCSMTSLREASHTQPHRGSGWREGERSYTNLWIPCRPLWRANWMVFWVMENVLPCEIFHCIEAIADN